MPEELADQVAAIGALVEPARRALYLYVSAQADPVSREQAATAVDVPLHSAKFHLDRLVEEELLDVEFRRLSGRTGPGAGRPSKLYRRSSRRLSVSLPERRYDLAGVVLASAIDRSMHDHLPISQVLRETAAAQGRQLAEAFVAEPEQGGTSRSLADQSPLMLAAAVLARHGYEPRTAQEEVRLANCPFDRLAVEHTELVCGMNHAMISGVVEELAAVTVVVELAPEPGFCCVKLTRRDTSA
jgi:predicted ArsR family transcriptional regulator